MIVWLVSRARRLNSSSLVLYIIQLIFIPIILLLSGFILIFQGWRLDPILQFSQLLLTLLILYLVVKDIFINAIYKNR
ncbi:Ycf66 family protein [Scytonema sp. NUACC26]|uniref:Ycf66 family protein n=1 Tax=Scytonema sp. NUACC26 TaxID=3140176 RepID=UPI0038B25FF5